MEAAAALGLEDPKEVAAVAATADAVLEVSVRVSVGAAAETTASISAAA